MCKLYYEYLQNLVNSKDFKVIFGRKWWSSRTTLNRNSFVTKKMEEVISVGCFFSNRENTFPLNGVNGNTKFEGFNGQFQNLMNIELPN